MTRSAAISAAIERQLSTHRAILDGPNSPNVVTVIVRLGPDDGRPVVALFRPEWEDRLQKKPRTA